MTHFRLLRVRENRSPIPRITFLVSAEGLNDLGFFLTDDVNCFVDRATKTQSQFLV